jgi:hypothetical protein
MDSVHLPVKLLGVVVRGIARKNEAHRRREQSDRRLS